MLTDDENIIDLQFAVQYILKDPKEFLFVNRTPEETVRQVAETAMREIVGKSKMDFVLYEGRADIAARAKPDAADSRSLQDRHHRQPGDHAEHSAAGAGAGRVRRCRQSRSGSRAPEERRPRLTPTTWCRVPAVWHRA